MKPKRKNVCFYFHIHQPQRLSKASIFNVGELEDYFTGIKGASNKDIFKKVAKKSYYPANKLFLKLLKKYPGFRLSYSITGVFLEQCEQYEPKLFDLIKEIVASGRVEILAETYHHSLASLYSYKEFGEQIMMHRQKIWDVFHKKPTVFRNTEFIYNNDIGNFVRAMGYKAMLTEGWEYYLGWRSPNHAYSPKLHKLSAEKLRYAKKYGTSKKPDHSFKLLLKNYKLSDDIAFRFSDKGWIEHPLTAEKFTKWCESVEGETINLFMDFETFGEHQWEDTGIFKFMEQLPVHLEKHNIGFKTVSETAENLKSVGELDVHHTLSWADMERDVSAWLGNEMQKSTADILYSIENVVKRKYRKEDSKIHERLINIWRKLQTSDNFYYMSTKYWKDGDVHKYFSPYNSPYEAYINYMNVLQDFIQKLREYKGSKAVNEIV